MGIAVASMWISFYATAALGGDFVASLTVGCLTTSVVLEIIAYKGWLR
jgi:hypothetical protein